MKPAANEPKVVKWLVGLAVVLVAAVILGVGAVLATSIFSGRSEAGAPC